MLHKLNIALLTIAIFSCHAAHTAPEQPTPGTQPMSYQDIGNSLLNAMGVIEKNKELTKEEVEKLFKEMPPLSTPEKVKLTCQMLSKQPSATTSNVPVTTLQAMKSTAKEMELFCGQGANPQNHLLSKIDNTITTFGQAALAKMLADPLDAIDVLRKRQALVKKMATDEKFMAKVDSITTSVAKKESDILSFWQQETVTSKESKNSLYAPKWLNFLNSSPTTISLWRTIQHPATIPSYIEGALSGLCAAYVKFVFFVMRKAEPVALAAYENEMKKNWDLLRDLLRPHIKPKHYIYAGLAVGSLLVGPPVVTCCLLSKKIKHDNTVLHYMQTRVSGAATLLKAARELRDLSQQDSTVAQGLVTQTLGLDQLEKKEQKIANLKTLVGELESSTFSDNYSYFSNSGKILHAYKLTEELKDEFAGLAQDLGNIDAYASVAKLYKKSQGKNATYCFVDYADQPKQPYLRLDSFWNPAIAPEKAVTNSIELGSQNGPRNIIVTGANMGGKSFALKGIVASILLSRLGIAPAKTATMTPFTHVATSMNISDDADKGISLFKAQALRSQSIIKGIKSLKEDQHAFVVLDELFAGTESKTGENAATNFLKQLSSFPNTICAMATHFKKPTELGNEPNGTCKNYKMEAHVDKDGKIIRTFKLEEGINTTNIADDILKENVDDIDSSKS